MAQLVSLTAEAGAFLGSGVLTHAFGTVGEEVERPWHHSGSWVGEVGELLPDWVGLALGEVACYSLKKGRLQRVEEVLGL